jgi:hypothetical protein
VAAVLDVPLAALLLDGLPVEEDWILPLPGERAPATLELAAGRQTRRIRFYPWREDKIWGATARMLESLLASVRAGRLTL